MRILSAPVLAVSALVTSPMLWQGLVTGERALEPVLERYLMVLVGVWLALSVLEMMVGEPPRPPQADDGGAAGSGGPGDAERPAGSALG